VIAWHLGEGHPWIYDRFALIAAAGIAMGLQSAVAHRAGIAGIATTYVTGTLTTVATRLVAGLRRSARRDDPVAEGAFSWLPAMAWLAYGGGAVFAGATYLWWPLLTLDIGGEVRWPSAALLLPIVVVATVIPMLTRGHRRGAARA
jgi:uncharacterized membrane protein YoaK (UPF0700 family)